MRYSYDLTGEARLPEGEEPVQRGTSADGISGYNTFVKPLDEHTTEAPKIPVLRKKKVIDWDSFFDDEGYGQGAVDKPRAPYRDGIPHNIENERFSKELRFLSRAPSRFLSLDHVYPVLPDYIVGKRVAISLELILDNLDPTFQERSKSCSAVLKRSDLTNLRWVFSVNCGNGPKAVKLRAVRPKKGVVRFSKMNLEVSCSCLAWKWLGPEYHARGERYLLGKPVGTASDPVVRDPDKDNRVCKHVAAVLSVARQWVIPVATKK